MMLEAERSVQQVWYGAEKRRYAMHLILCTSVVEGFDVVTLEVQDGTLSLCSVTQMRVDGEEGECVTYGQNGLEVAARSTERWLVTTWQTSSSSALRP